MTTKQTLRQKALQDSEQIASKSRFGLFSHPISNAVGDDGPYKTKIHPKNQQGKPVTQERNIVTSPAKKGQIDSSYFSPLNPLASSPIKDIYIDEEKRLLLQYNKKFNKNRNPENFIPNSNPKSLSSSAYEYIQQKTPIENPKRNRNEDGSVKISPKNICSNPQSNINETYFKHPSYKIDPYQRRKQYELSKISKSMISDAPFKPNSFVPQTFHNNRNIYHQDPSLKKKQTVQTNLNIYKHESAWKSSSPNKQGLFGCFSPYPKYIQNPPKEIARRASDMNTKQAFKNMSYSCHKNPTPSVSQTNLNLKKIAIMALRH